LERKGLLLDDENDGRGHKKAKTQNHILEGRTIQMDDSKANLISSVLGRRLDELMTPTGEIDIGRLSPSEILTLENKGIIILTSKEKQNLIDEMQRR
jgi:hypothetical protein